MGSYNYRPTYFSINTLHCTVCNTGGGSKEKYATVGIITVVFIERRKKTASRYSFRQGTFQKFRAEIKNTAVAHHPFGLIVATTKILVRFKPYQMVYIRGEEHPTVESLEEFGTCQRLYAGIQNPDYVHGLLIRER